MPFSRFHKYQFANLRITNKYLIFPNSRTIFRLIRIPNEIVFTNSRTNISIFPNSRTIFRLFPNPERNRFPEFPNDIFHFPEFPNDIFHFPEFPNGKKAHSRIPEPPWGGSQTLWSEVVFVYDSMPLLREHEFASIWHIVRHFMTRTRVRVRV